MGKAKKKEEPPADDDAAGGGGSTSNNVYVRNKEFAWVPARLISQTADKAEVEVAQYPDEFSILSGGKAAIGWKKETVQLKEYDNKALPLQNVKGEDLIEKEDMVDLPFLHEAAILYNVKARHGKALPYTRTGDIVIAVNPYQWLTHLYEEKPQIDYSNTLVWDELDDDPRKLLEPHIYEISSLCYRGLAVDRKDQSILVSGESGAGKTETVKICMKHMAAVQRGPAKAGGEAYESVVVQRVLESNPLLEAFGNAKTRRNDNSSRFGKYINLQFKRRGAFPGKNTDHCEIAGSKCNVYLLEKSRIVQHEDIEGTYHIFYYLVSASDEAKKLVWDGLLGKNYDSYKYVGNPPYERRIEGMSDAENYDFAVKTMSLIHVKGDELKMLMRAIAITLSLGNVNFAEDPKDEERSQVTTKPEFEAAREVLGVDSKVLELSFIEKTVKTRTEEFKVPMKHDLAKECCDAFAKEIYSRLFLWLVREINAATCAEDNFEGGGQTGFGTIGLLDIFGFESFPVNGFEQLCINYANEKLQQKFTKDIFESVQLEYEAEGIDLEDITYDDNSDVLELIEGRTGLIKMLNEECVRPKGDEKTFVSKLVSGNKKMDCLIAERRFRPTEFGVHHYAGKVIYLASDWIGRNNDTLPADLHACAKLSDNGIVRDHLTNDAMMKNEVKEDTGKAPKRAKSNLSAETIWTKFKTQLASLMVGLSTTRSRYIRCLKPNTIKKPLLMHHMTTVEQLRCAGVVAAVTISRSAFPNKFSHEEALNRFKVMKQKGAKTSDGDAGVQVDALFEPVLKKFEVEGKKGYVMGKTNVYFKGGVLEYLEQEKNKYWETWVIVVQRYMRGCIVRANKAKLLLMAPGPQSTRIQIWWRSYLANAFLRQKLKKFRAQMKLLKKKNKLVTRIQALVRGVLWRPKFQAILEEQKEKVRLRTARMEIEEKMKRDEEEKQKEIDAAREVAEKEIEEYKNMVQEELTRDKAHRKRTEQQQTLIDESGKIIEFLRKENTKLRTQNDSLRKDYKKLKQNNQALMEANASASHSFSALNDHAKQLNITNAKLVKNVEAYKQQLEKLKDDLKTRHAYYLAEAEARLAYQKTTAQIVTMLQTKCTDKKLIEQVVFLALDCEEAAKKDRAKLEERTKAAAAAGAAPPRRASQQAAPKKAAANDSDSDSD